MEIFGYKISKNGETEEKDLSTFSSVQPNDGSIEVETGVDFAGQSKYILNLDSEFTNEKQRIDTYRNAAKLVDMSTAIDQIVNESIVSDDDDIIDLLLDKSNFSGNVKKKISEEFTFITTLLDFNNKADDIFKRWYIDGKIYFHKVVGKNEKNGIEELRYLDPRRVKKVHEVIKDSSGKPIKTKEYFVYSLTDYEKQSTIVYGDQKALEIHPDMIAYAHSGLVSDDKFAVDSYIQKAIKPLNQLLSLEDALVVYRVSRAPERRIFYIDVGNLPKTRAEQYLKDIIGKYKNKITYDASTGSFTNNKNQVSMMEDIWLPRRDGSRGTEVSTLPGGQSLGELDDVEYFRKKLWKALHMPMSRMPSDAQFNIGRSSEISRDEVIFNKFVKKLQSQFGVFILEALKTQLLLKNIITLSDWNENKNKLSLKFNSDNYFSEMKETELLNDRLATLDTIDQYVGKYFSPDFVMKNILKMTETEIEETEAQIKSAKESGKLPKDEEM